MHDVMRDPVSTIDGQTYGRAAIEEWLRGNDTSPLTGAVLEMKRLIPNHALRSVAQGFLREQPEHAAEG